MPAPLYTVEQAAERLKLHPKTVLRMIHEGRLEAARVGKAYRITGEAIDAAAGIVRAEVRESSDRATVIADFGGLSPDLAMRFTNALTGMLNSREARPAPIRLDAAYDPDLRRVQVVVIGPPEQAAAILKAAAALVAAWR